MTVNTVSTIDNIITNISDCTVEVSESEVSDQRYQVINFPFINLCEIDEIKTINYRETVESNLNLLKCYLCKEKWLNIYKEDDINYSYNTLLSNLLYYFTSACPIKTKLLKNKNSIGKIGSRKMC